MKAVWDIEAARQTYSVTHWSDGYYDINAQGNVVVFPRGKENATAIELSDIIARITEAGLRLPALLRFPDILTHRIMRQQQSFAQAMQAMNYAAHYSCVYPIKVNQQSHVIQQFIKTMGQSQISNASIGLEAGSKPELMAVLAMAGQGRELTKQPFVIVCNGYKDREYIRLALIGQQLGHRVYIIIERVKELALVLQEAQNLEVQPTLGVRVRLNAIAHGKWQNTGGERSKFGLTASQLLQVVAQLKASKNLNALQLLHCHMGSQIANIRDIQRGVREFVRYYVEICSMGADIKTVDVGGGLGVDYEGSRSRTQCSMNYTLEEYAHNIVHVLDEACRENDLPHPNIITESGRTLAAHHAVLISNVIDAEQRDINISNLEIDDNMPTVLQDLYRSAHNIEQRSLLEIYHDACHAIAEANTMYMHGVLTLAELAYAERLYFATCAVLQQKLSLRQRAQREVLDEINTKLALKLFTNFSLFQSLPDIWAIQQVFPIMPLSHLHIEPSQRAIVQDITCDSDGRIDKYVDSQSLENTLPIPDSNTDIDYTLGFFLVGAYQEILGDMHNLFGDTDSVNVVLNDDGSYHLEQIELGDTVSDVLRYVHFEPQQLLASYRHQLESADLSQTQRVVFLAELESGLEGYTYLED